MRERLLRSVKMFKCQYCDREIKSKAGLVKHEGSCKSRPAEEDVEVVKPEKKVVQLEVLGMGGHYPDGKDNNYYEGHPKRIVKLKGLLSRTRDSAERRKIMKLVVELRRQGMQE